MSEQLQLRRDTQANLASVTPAAGEPAYDTTRAGLLIGDGVAAGGINLALTVFCPGFVANRYYIGSTGPSTNVLALTANTLYLAPFVAPIKQTFTKIGVSVTTAAGANGRLGIYTLGAALAGGNLVIDAGAVAIGTTGLKEITGLNVTLNPGLYGLAILPDTNISVQAGTPLNVLTGAIAPGSTGVNQAIESFVSQAQSYGALPSSLSATPTYLTGNPPGVWLRL